LMMQVPVPQQRSSSSMGGPEYPCETKARAAVAASPPPILLESAAPVCRGAFSRTSESQFTMSALNVLGTALQACSYDPLTGYFRDGCCNTDAHDHGTHVVCAKVTPEFLAYSLQRGNDLVTPRPEYRFSGLRPGDRWCLCVNRWLEALEAGVAPPVHLEATNAQALERVSLDQLREYAL
jgi:uncharacterized protein (DUF2237 family)